MRKLTFDYVKQYFADQGCELLETEYINSHHKMKYICSCGKLAESNWNNFQYANACKDCNIKKRIDLSRLKYYYVCFTFQQNGCELLEKEYRNAYTKMKYKCICGNISNISFTNFKKGKRCKECGLNKLRAFHTLSFDYVNQYFIDNNCELLEDNYIDCTKLMKYRCSCGNTDYVSFNKFQQGERCNKCSGERAYLTSPASERKYLQKENHPMWNPNLTDEDRAKNNTRAKDIEVRKWKKRIFQRDKYTCQICGTNKSNRLNAHHLNSYNMFPNEYIDDENGITLCKDCHINFHKTYGYGDNTKEQFSKWVQEMFQNVSDKPRRLVGTTTYNILLTVFLITIFLSVIIIIFGN